jgi:hypothetical protein
MGGQAGDEPTGWGAGAPLFADAACHRRWAANGPAARAADDGLGPAQCGWCRYAIPLQGALRWDWGVCSNPASPKDGRVVFEPDGEWVIG